MTETRKNQNSNYFLLKGAITPSDQTLNIAIAYLYFQIKTKDYDVIETSL